jgi:hypothetical protein
MRIGYPGPLLGIRRMIMAAAAMPRMVWLALNAPVLRGIRRIADARREHAVRRARYWGTYS